MHNLKRVAYCWAGLCAVPYLAGARPVLDDFEHGNESLWAQQTEGDNFSIVGAAAHDGALGATFAGGLAGWRTRFDLSTAPGNAYRAYVRWRGTIPAGRLYLGVGATPGGCWSAVFSPATSQVLLQANIDYEFITVASVPFTPVPDVWYVLETDWAANGELTARLYEESGATLLVQTTPFLATVISPGGVAIRGFNTVGSTSIDMDTIASPDAPCYPDCNADGVLTVADFGCFQTKFVAGDPYADCNGVGGLTVADFGCFQTTFVGGCP